MKVVATKQGFDNLVVRNPGEVFDMPDNSFEKRPKIGPDGKPTGQIYDPPDWFEPYDEARPVPKRKGDRE